MRNDYINQLGIEIRRASFIQRMFNKIQGLTFDIIVNGHPVYTSFDVGDAKQFCIDNRLSTKMIN